MSEASERVTAIRTAMAVVLVALAVLTVPTGAVTAQGAPSLVLSRSSDLVPGEVVQADASGFTPGTKVYFLTCIAGAASVVNCDLGTLLGNLPVDGAGELSVDYPVVRDIVAPRLGSSTPELIDCALQACEVVVAPIDASEIGRASVSFVDTARLPASIGLSTPLPSTSFRIVGQGLPAARRLTIRTEICTEGNCSTDLVGTVDTAADGTLDAPISLPVHAQTLEACEQERCRLLALLPGLLTADFEVAATRPTVVLPDFTVAVEPDATLDADRDLVDATATVDCDRPTPFSLWAYLSQGGTVRRYQLGAQVCTPGVPTQVWLPGRLVVQAGPGFDLSHPVEVEVRVSPLIGTNIYYQDVFVGSATLHDYDQLVAAVVDLASQPGNEGLFSAIVDAIRARSAQDPVFHAELFNPV